MREMHHELEREILMQHTKEPTPMLEQGGGVMHLGVIESRGRGGGKSSKASNVAKQVRVTSNTATNRATQKPGEAGQRERAHNTQ